VNSGAEQFERQKIQIGRRLRLGHDVARKIVSRRIRMNGRLCRHLALIAVTWLSSVPAAAIMLGEFDDFQSGTSEMWTGGIALSNQPNGGPDGVGDRYLRLDSGGGNLGIFNETQWAGNYAGAGVTRVTFDLNNFGPSPVSLRVMIATPGCSAPPLTCTAWTSTNATVLPITNGWVKVEFSLAELDLTRVLGSASYASSIVNVQKLLLRHDDGGPSPPGSQMLVDADLGMDNVVALPEPSPRAAFVAGVFFLTLLIPKGKRTEPGKPISHGVVRDFLNDSSAESV
jgi:hypothetical protein